MNGFVRKPRLDFLFSSVTLSGYRNDLSLISTRGLQVPVTRIRLLAVPSNCQLLSAEAEITQPLAGGLSPTSTETLQRRLPLSFFSPRPRPVAPSHKVLLWPQASSSWGGRGVQAGERSLPRPPQAVPGTQVSTDAPLLCRCSRGCFRPVSSLCSGLCSQPSLPPPACLRPWALLSSAG